MPRSDLVLITQRCEAHNMKLIKEPLFQIFNRFLYQVCPSFGACRQAAASLQVV